MQTAADVKQATQAEIDRKKDLDADTAKLLELANQLKTEMGKTTKDTLSVNVIRKAQEIERLAHKVREEMKYSVSN